MVAPVSKITNPWLFGDTSTVAGIPDVEPTFTKVGGVDVSAMIEFQSTTKAPLLTRQTSAQIAAITPVVDGMFTFNSDTGTIDLHTGGAWEHVLFASNAYTFPVALPTVSGFPFVVSTGGVVTYDTNYPLTATGTLTNGQCIHLFDTAVSLIPTPGAGKIIEVGTVVWEVLSTGHTAFATGGAVSLIYGTTAAGTNFASSSTAAAFFQNAANFIISTLGNINGTTGLDSTLVVNQPVSVTCATQNFTAGAGSTIAYTIHYRIISAT